MKFFMSKILLTILIMMKKFIKIIMKILDLLEDIH